MKTIIYGVAGEGLGHATRAHALIEELSSEFKIRIFTFGDAYLYFDKLIQNESLNVQLFKIPGLRFGRNQSNQITRLGTIKAFVQYYQKDHHVAVETVLRHGGKNGLVITDFEPSTAEAGRRLKLPVVSVDNQHKFSYFKTDGLPLDLKCYCNLTGWFTDWYIGEIAGCVISTFYHDYAKPNTKVITSNIFLRRYVKELDPSDEGYLLVYHKSSVGPELLHYLSKLDYPVRIFGANSIGESRKNLSFHSLNYREFAKSLAGCRALFCTSGNQLLGEACYFSKPVFTIPEPNQQEQSVNAYYATKMGFAEKHEVGEYDDSTIDSFLKNFRTRPQSRINGVDIAVETIRSFA